VTAWELEDLVSGKGAEKKKDELLSISFFPNIEEISQVLSPSKIVRVLEDLVP